MRRFVPPAPRTSYVRLLAGIVVALGLALTTISAQIPGRNVNMVAGNVWPQGDPYLQRQNEPSVAASTRNPLHLLAGSNDYRTVDVPGLPGDEIGDAWLGLYKSYDGGQRWTSTLLPGYPQDQSVEGLASPIHGYGAGADPVVRAGTNGLIYYAGLAFDRTDPQDPENYGKSAIFVARFIDNNNKEAGDTFEYLGTRVMQNEKGGKRGDFLDKPWMAVDIPRYNTRCTITTPGEKGPIVQSVPAGPVYIAYTVKIRDKQGERYDVMFTKSADCGNTWAVPVRVNNEGDRANQGATMAIDPRNGNVYIAWRRFDVDDRNDDAMMTVKYSPVTQKFDPPGTARRFPKGKKKGLDPNHFFRRNGVNDAVAAAQLSPFDQGTSPINELLAFRTNAYPSMTADENGRLYMVWTERGFTPPLYDPVAGDARILMATSLDGHQWSAPIPVSVEGQRGHQLMPSITYAGGQLMLAYYDLRETRSQSFTKWIDDVTAFANPQGTGLRHTIDLRASSAAPGASPVFGQSVRVSDYLEGPRVPGGPNVPLQVNPPNLPMFKQGTAPFLGDYVDITAAPNFIQDATGKWIFNTAPGPAAPIFHAVWTDNRDVRVPLEDPDNDGNPWNNYTPPGAVGGLPSIFDPSQTVAQCIPGNAGSRNQNVYTARITGGLLVGSPGNTKTLSADLQRSFVVFVQNTNDDHEPRTFRLTITNQPAGGRASFEQFPLPPYTNLSPPPLTVIDAVVPRLSTASRTVYVTSSDPHARVNVEVVEIESLANPVPPVGALRGVIVLNPDIDNPDIDNPDIDNPDIDNPDIDNAEVYNPDIDNPDIDNPDIDNPDIDNPDIDNPDIDNIRVANPDIDNPDIDNPDIDNPDIDNPDIDNPDIDNPDIDNTSLMTDINWRITNTGNTTAAYNVNLFFAQQTFDPTIQTQLILYRTYKTPVVQNCVLKSETRNVLVTNVPNPQLVKASTGEVSNPNDPEPENATIYLAPGESAKITLRVFDPSPDPGSTQVITNADGSTAVVPNQFVPNEDVTPVVQQQGVDTEDAEAGVTEPPIVVQFPPPQTENDSVSTAALTPVTINVLANDSTAFGSTKIISLHPAGMATHSGTGPGDIVFQPSTGYLYTQRGAIDPASDALVGRFPPPTTVGGIGAQIANPRTGINYGRGGIQMTALDARPGSPTFHQYLPLPPVPANETVVAMALDTTHHRLYAIRNTTTIGPVTSTIFGIDIDPGSPTFHQQIFATALPVNTRGSMLGVNSRTQRVYVPALGSAGGVYVLDATLPAPPAIKIAGTTTGNTVVVNEASNLVFVAFGLGPQPTGPMSFYAIDGATNAVSQVNTALPMRTGSVDERMAVHEASGRVYIRLEDQVVVIDGQRGSPTRNMVLTTVPVGRDGNVTDIAVDQELGLVVTTATLDYRSDIISVATNSLVATIPNERGASDVAIDQVQHRAFISVGLTHVQEIDLTDFSLDATVTVFVESGGVIVNPVTNKAYTGITVKDTRLGKISGAGFGGLIPGTLTTGRFLFSARHDATDRYFFVNPSRITGDSASDGTVTVIDGATDAHLATLEVPGNPFGIGINQATARAYVATLSQPFESGVVMVGNLNDLNEDAIIADSSAIPPMSGAPTPAILSFGRHVVVNPNTGNVYTLVMGGSPATIAVLDPNTNALAPLDGAAALPLGSTWGRVEVIRVDPVQNRIYVGMTDPVTATNRVIALDGDTHAVLGTFVGGKHSNRHTASWVVVNPATNRVFVSNYDTDTVTMLDGATMLPLATTVVPAGPSAMVLNETANRLYVSSIDSKMISALTGTNLAIESSVRLPLQAFFLVVDEVESRIYTSGGDSQDESGVMVITDILGQLGTNVSVESVGSALNGGTVQLNADYSVTYTPAPGFSGVDQFTYEIAAPTGTAIGTVFVNVAPSTAASVSFGDAYTVGANQPLSVNAPGPMANDAPGPGLVTLDVVQTTVNGDLTPQPDGSFLYVPDLDFTGIDTFTYRTIGPLGTSNTVTVTITVLTPTDLVVTTADDAGAGSLRQAISIANLEPNASIRFDIPGAGPHTIALASALPTLTSPMTIDGYTQPGSLPNSAAIGTNAQIMIQLRGNAITGSSVHGLTINGGATTVRGLAIGGFSGTGIFMDLAGNNVIEGNFIGTDYLGTTAVSNNGGGVTSQSANNWIGGSALGARNLIAGNNGTGIRVQPRVSGGVVTNDGSGTMIVNNLVGTNAGGTGILGNSGGITVSVPNVTIGGPSAADRNVVSGNNGSGISTFASTTVTAGPPATISIWTRPANLAVLGNYIGVSANGTAAVRNVGSGVNINGEDSVVRGNVVSGNTGNGISVGVSIDSTTQTVTTTGEGTIIEGNYLGTNEAGAAAILAVPTGNGISVSAPDVRIGGTLASQANLISGNINGINFGTQQFSNGTLASSGAFGKVLGNVIGLNKDGDTAVPNTSSGVFTAVPDVEIGDGTAAGRNVIAGNSGPGVSAFANVFSGVVVSRPERLKIRGNYIGTDVTGMIARANNGGVSITGADSVVGGATGTTPGGNCTGDCNLIAGNTATGVNIQSNFDGTTGTVWSAATGTLVQGNYIGVRVDGTAALANTGAGVFVSVQNVTIGGSTAAARNVIAGNGSQGISISNSFLANNTIISKGDGAVVKGNYIGVNAAGTATIANGNNGVNSQSATTTIGGPNPGDGNLVGQGGSTFGINLARQTNGPVVINAGGNGLVQGNTVGLTFDHSAKLANGFGSGGIGLQSAGNTIRGNVVAGVGQAPTFAPGITLFTAFAANNVIAGNTIGTNPAGAAGLGNNGPGVSIQDASGNTVGGTNAADRNVIAGNNNNGITINANTGTTANGNVILGNYIGVKPDGLTSLANTNNGINLFANGTGVVSGTIIGGTVGLSPTECTGACNVVGSNFDGISLGGAGTSNTSVLGNYVGVSKDGTIALASNTGIWIGNGAHDNTIGGSSAAEGNVIANQNFNGIGIQPSSVRNRIRNNSIHSNAAQGIDLGFDGVTINDAGDGDTGANERQNFPILNNAETTPALVSEVDVNLTSFAAGIYTVQIFANPACDTGGHGEGRLLVGNMSLSAGGMTRVALDQVVANGEWLTATASDSLGNTSEFSSCTRMGGFVVTNTNDSGSGSLRNAIMGANTTPGQQTILFNIPGATPAAPAVIAVSSALPVITDSVIIAGHSHPAFDGRPVIAVLNNAGAGTDGLDFNANNVVVRGLMIQGFNTGVVLRQSTGGHILQDLIVGTDRTNAAGLGNTTGISWQSNTSTLLSSVVSGNTGDEIALSLGDANTIQGNMIGIGHDGIAALPAGGAGIALFGGAEGTVIENNLISGNGQWGIDIRNVGTQVQTTRIRGNTIGLNGANAPAGNLLGGIRNDWGSDTIIGSAALRNTIGSNGGPGISVLGNPVTIPIIQNNWIGIDNTGLAARPNTVGILVDGNTPALIGGSTSDGNVISGNTQSGIQVTNNPSVTPSVGISGNIIGLDKDGANVVANGAAGITATSSAITVGGASADLRNVISGNQYGIQFSNAGSTRNSTIRGNYIGTDVSGTLARGNSTGILIGSAPGTVVGGTGANEGNVISGNAIGVTIDGISQQVISGLYNATVQGNILGLNATLSAAVPGSTIGISLGTSDNLIGGTASGAPNAIGFNTVAGIRSGASTALRNRLMQNMIFDNGGLGIDLGGVGVTANDAGDGDAGANGLLNFPVLSNATNAFGGATRVNVDLSSSAVGNYTVEFYSSPTCDASGHGEGPNFVGSRVIVQPGESLVILDTLVQGGHFITATARDDQGNTSEFSACTPVPLVVVNANDSGPGSLRQMILDANATPGAQVITFDIPGVTVFAPAVINLASALPVITQPVVIDATSQPSWDGLPVVEVNGQNSVANGFETAFDVVQVTIQGFSITQFTNAGIFLSQNDTALVGNTVTQNRLGTDRNAAGGKGNATGIIVRSDHSSISSNVISGNTDVGILLENDADNVTILFNTIGLANAGMLPNGTDGIRMYHSLNNNVIDGNVISANSGWGINLQNSLPGQVTGTQIFGNRIGLDFAGNDAGNALGGIRLDTAPSTKVGVPGEAPNVISGNGGVGPQIGPGIQVVGAAAVMPVIQNNYIGLDPSGDFARSNNNKGIELQGPAQVGGSNLGDRNYISGNGDMAGGAGIFLGLNAGNSVIQGNVIGLDVNDEPAGNGYAGITLTTVNGPVTIGGVLTGEANIISSNGAYGIAIQKILGGDPVPGGHFVLGNVIGTTSNLLEVRGNGNAGIYAGGNNLTIGDIDSGGNFIVNNGAKGGIVVPAGTLTGITINRNHISSNAGLAIDLGDDGVTANDPGDTDSGANELQNFPPITNAWVEGSNNTIATIDRNALAGGTTYRVEFFANQICHASGHGPASGFVHAVDGVAGGFGSLDIDLGTHVPAGFFLSATATNETTGSTSELGNCQEILPAFQVDGTAGGQVNTNNIPSGTNPVGTFMLNPGQQVTISAVGLVNYGVGTSGPDGIGPAGPQDLDPSLPTISLIGRIGFGPWQLIGSGPTVLTAGMGGGLLELAVNDSWYDDNSGFFRAYVKLQ